MKKILIAGLALSMAGVAAAQVTSPKFAIKANDDIILGKPLNVTMTEPGHTAKTSANAFSLDFGWKFWEKGANSLELNLGIGYSFLGSTFSLNGMNFTYAAGATGDDDYDPYQRYVQLDRMRQKSTVGHIQVPLYLDYEFRAAKWLGIYAEAGFNFGFRVFNSTGSTTGSYSAFGVYSQYDDLLIDADYLNNFAYPEDYNHFGTRELLGSKHPGDKSNVFNCTVLCGAGFEFYTYEPVSFIVGVRYQVGLNSIYKSLGATYGNGGQTTFNGVTYQNMTEAQAPVTYTAWEGDQFVNRTQVRSLGDFISKNRYNPLSLHVGVNVRF